MATTAQVFASTTSAAACGLENRIVGSALGNVRYVEADVLETQGRLRGYAGVDEKTALDLTYNANDQINAVEQYDLNGNLIQDQQGNTYRWDSEDRLVSRNGGAVTLTYDGDGSRVGTAVNGVATTYLVDDQNPTSFSQVMEGVAGGVVSVNTVGAMVLAERSLPTTEYLLHDGQRSVRAVVLASGGVAGSTVFDAFGVKTQSTGVASAHGFVGEWTEFDGTWLFLRARHLVVDTGRMPSGDPWAGTREVPGTQHRYIYVQNNPLTSWDPSGRVGTSGEQGTAVSILGITLSVPIADFVALGASVAIRAATVVGMYWPTAMEIGSAALVGVQFLNMAAVTLAENANRIPPGPAPRGDVIHDLARGNLGHDFPEIDDFRDGIGTSIKSREVTSEAELIAALERDAGALEGISGRRLRGLTSSGARMNIPIGGVTQGQLLLAVPETARAFLTSPTFVAAAQRVANATNIVSRIVVVRGWRPGGRG